MDARGGGLASYDMALHDMQASSSWTEMGRLKFFPWEMKRCPTCAAAQTCLTWRQHRSPIRWRMPVYRPERWPALPDMALQIS